MSQQTVEIHRGTQAEQELIDKLSDRVVSGLLVDADFSNWAHEEAFRFWNNDERRGRIDGDNMTDEQLDYVQNHTYKAMRYMLARILSNVL